MKDKTLVRTLAIIPATLAVAGIAVLVAALAPTTWDGLTITVTTVTDWIVGVVR